jgi:hypothetical protein
MTIAACYLSAEGVVFGADSTTTMYVSGVGPGAQGSEHHFNFAQKIFQVGKHSTLGMTMWGLGGIPGVSYRTLIAQFADSLVGQSTQSICDVSSRWNQLFWGVYSTQLSQFVQRAQQLAAQPTRTPDEEGELLWMVETFSGGFCLGGYLMNDRTPSAYEIRYDPRLAGPGPIDALAIGTTRFWGCPSLINRVLLGVDEWLYRDIVGSGKWAGTEQELMDLIRPYCLGQPQDLPIREAIDWLHASIYTTIKTMKFSHMAPVCGGPVEVAVITTDRQFRWVRHKPFDAAIGDGGLNDVYRDVH